MSLRLTTGRATAGVRRLVARHRWMRWLPVAGCTAVLLMAAHAYADAADSTRAQWGHRRTVWVAVDAVEPGSAIVAHRTELPLVAVPDSAVADPPDGRIARQRIDAGAVVTEFDVGGTGRLSLLPDGWRAVAITESPSSGAAIGDRVDVVSEGVVLVEDAVVVELLDEAVLIGAPADVAPMIALAAESDIALLLIGAVAAAP